MFESKHPVEIAGSPLDSPRQRYIEGLRGDLSSLLNPISQPQQPQGLQLKALVDEHEVSPTFQDDGHIEHICGSFFEMFKSVGTLGSGCAGVVKKVICRETQKKYAVKIVRTRDEETVNRAIEEFNRIKMISLPDVIHLHKLYLDQPHGCYYLLMELFQGQPLSQFAETISNLPEGEFVAIVQRVVYQIASTLRQLHFRGIVHRDLAPGNVLVNSDGEIKIIDFNVSKMFPVGCSTRKPGKTEKTKFKMMTMTGTPNYRAPEMVSGSIYSESVDLWSLGCLMYRLVTGQDAFEGEYVQEVLDSVLHKKLTFGHKNWQVLGEEGIALARKLLDKDPAKRPTAAEVVSTTWFKYLKQQDDSPTDSALAREVQKLRDCGQLKFCSMEFDENDEDTQAQLDEFASQLCSERRLELVRKASLDDRRAIRPFAILEQVRKTSALTFSNNRPL